MTSLTGVFSPGAPPLLESLRTLTVTPQRTVSPGEIVRAEFSFSNSGGATASGVRVRFALPSGVTAVEGSDTVDGAPLSAGQLTAVDGALLDDLPPNAARRVACSFRVHDRIEDGSDLIFQAALITDQTPVVASNVERIVVRSEPVLQNSSTIVTIGAPEHPKPGDTITITATVTNTGTSSAHDILVYLPLPPQTRYVARSARIAGRAVGSVPDEPFDYANQTIVAERLAPGQSVSVEYQATIEPPLADGTRIKAIGAISSLEVEEFSVPSADVVVHSPADFSNDETSLTIFCDDVVTPGTRVPMTLRALNSGTGDAHQLQASFDLPEGLVYTPGSTNLDGQPVFDEAFEEATLFLGTLPAGRVADVGVASIVTTQNAQDLPISATLRWKGGQRRFTRTLRVRASSRFTRARNYIEANRTTANAREDVEFTVHVFNDGTASEENVDLRLLPGAFLEDLRVNEDGAEPVAYGDVYVLGTVAAHTERVVTIHARVGSPVPDRSQLAMGAVVEFATGSFDLGTASVIVRSRPHVAASSCSWERVTHEPLRPGRLQEIALRFVNDGSDVLRDARMDISLPPELAIDRAQNAHRDGPGGLRFGDVPAETTHEARVMLRLLRAPRRDRTLNVRATLTGRGTSPVHFSILDVPTFAQPEFEADAQLRSNPPQNVNAGEKVTYELLLRNSGDGPADSLVVRVVPSNLAVYLPGSTSLNGVPLADDLGTSQLWSQRGLLLTDVNPTVDLRIKWEVLVITPLSAGTSIETRAVIDWDGDCSLGLAAPPLRVVSSPVLEAGAEGTPISVAALQPALEIPAPEAIVPPPIEQHARPQPAATQAEDVPEAAAPQPRTLPPPSIQPAPVRPPAAPAAVAPQHYAPSTPPFERPNAPVLYVEFSPERLTQTIETLEQSEAGGLIPHLFAIRAFLPENAGGADPRLTQTLTNAVHAVRAPLDRLFVRLRVPRLAITAKDLEDRDSRFALRALLAAVVEAPAQAPPQRMSGIVRVGGVIDTAALRRRLGELESAPLGSVIPWIVYAELLGTRIEYNGGASMDVRQASEAMAAYRSQLQNVFGVLENLPMPEFHRVLSSSVNRSLDDALMTLREALVNAVHASA
jgi:uncharacterized repeat protein (TIGR01451 family)